MPISVERYDIKDILFHSEIVFKSIIGDFNFGIKIKSPLRKDSHPSFSCKKYQNTVLFKDFGTGEQGNVIKFVSLYYNIDQRTAISKCNDILSIGNYKPTIINNNTKTSINNQEVYASDLFTVEYRDWDLQDLKYWNSINITEDILELYSVKPVQTLFYNGYVKWLNVKGCSIYEYNINYLNNKEWYRPTALKNYRHIGNIRSYCIKGLAQLEDSEFNIITKSYKDVMVLKSLNINAVCAASESVTFKEKEIKKIKSKANKTFTFFDNDEAGIKRKMEYEKKYNLNGIIIDNIYKAKDISDFILKYKKEKTLEFLNNTIHDCNKKSTG